MRYGYEGYYGGNDQGPREPSKTFNINAHFIAPNPPTSFAPKSVPPTVDPTAYVGPFSSIIGDVTVGENVFIAPNVSIRADEGTPFYIGPGTNLQDGVILHGLAEGKVTHDNRKYSIYIGSHVTCAHGCMIHGPCKLGSHTFVGFNSIVFNAIVSPGCYISINALVTGGIKIAANRYVPAGSVIDTQAKADRLGPVPESDRDFAKEVLHINGEFPGAYALLFGSTRCSCGLACDPSTLSSFQ